MTEGFEGILDECIDRLRRGESLEQCLERYPEQAAELEPLLRVALAAHKASSVEPRPEFKAQARYQIQSVLRTRERKRPSRRVPFLGWLPRWATAILVAVFVFLMAGGGTVAAASDSMPGDILYPVKMATERVQIAFTFSDGGKAELHAKFAGRRAEEVARMAERGDVDWVEALTLRLDDHLRRVGELAAMIKQAEPGDGKEVAGLRQRLWRNAARNMDILGIAEGKAPDRSRPAVTRARAMMMGRYQAAIEALDNGQE